MTGFRISCVDPESSKSLKVSTIRAIKEGEMMYQAEKKQSEREMDLSTELLASAGVEEPHFLNLIRTATLIKGYLALCTIVNLMTMFIVPGGRLKMFYLAKSVFTAFGFGSMMGNGGSKMRSRLLFTGLFGSTVILESIPAMGGLLLLFSHDICSVLAGGVNDLSNGEKFIRFCRQNVDWIRLLGSSVIVGEVVADAVIFLEMVRHVRYLKDVEIERSSLNYYTGKERISLA